jgi:hypothetical protein
MLKRLIVCMTVVAVLGAAGCCRKAPNADEEAAEKIVERAIRMSSGNKAEVDISGETVRIQSEEGDVVMSSGGNAKLPDTFPKDVPVYKGAEIVHTMAQGTGAHSVTMRTGDDMEKVAAYYDSELASKGWKKAQEINMAGRVMRGYEKGGRVVSVMGATADGKTHISLTVASK